MYFFFNNFFYAVDPTQRYLIVLRKLLVVSGQFYITPLSPQIGSRVSRL